MTEETKALKLAHLAPFHLPLACNPLIFRAEDDGRKVPRLPNRTLWGRSGAPRPAAPAIPPLKWDSDKLLWIFVPVLCLLNPVLIALDFVSPASLSPGTGGPSGSDSPSAEALGGGERQDRAAAPVY